MINHLHGIGFDFSLSVYYAFRQKQKKKEHIYNRHSTKSLLTILNYNKDQTTQ